MPLPRSTWVVCSELDGNCQGLICHLQAKHNLQISRCAHLQGGLLQHPGRPALGTALNKVNTSTGSGQTWLLHLLCECRGWKWLSDCWRLDSSPRIPARPPSRQPQRESRGGENESLPGSREELGARRHCCRSGSTCPCKAPPGSQPACDPASGPYEHLKISCLSGCARMCDAGSNGETG